MVAISGLQIIYIILGLIGLVVLVQSFRVKEKKIMNMPKFLVGFAGFVIVGLMIVQMGWLASFGINPLTAGIGNGGNQNQDTDNDGGVPTCPTGMVLNTAGLCVSPRTGEVAKALLIESLSTISKEKYSNSQSAVSGTLRIYNSDVDPKTPTASTIDTITVSSGTGTSTNKKLRTDTAYRVVLDGAGTYYDKDYGVMTFTAKDYNPNTGSFLFDLGEVAKVSTIDDMLNESDVSGLLNGQASITCGTDEICGGEASENVTYDESVGDGQFYIKPTISFSGANTEIKEPVVCFEWDTTNPPEGNELSALDYQLISGTDFGFADSSWLNYWSTQSCLSAGSIAKGGVSSSIKLTLTVDEANLANNADKWYLYVDDLSGIRAKDARLNTGATYDRTLFDSQA